MNEELKQTKEELKKDSQDKFNDLVTEIRDMKNGIENGKEQMMQKILLI